MSTAFIKGSREHFRYVFWKYVFQVHDLSFHSFDKIFVAHKLLVLKSRLLIASWVISTLLCLESQHLDVDFLKKKKKTLFFVVERVEGSQKSIIIIIDCTFVIVNEAEVRRQTKMGS